ncbi:T-complex protein 1 subunit beta [Galendromus occidentalis]|uniref:T-complex protein 1 subunit beta n=1 Tax=Galendromus occidentalis TaxID=34638 RepID=A0AAJ7SGJ0_9ACAR|nr:T-complex protein 1 subunit beta [Galendromus occidentalis]
MAHLGNLNPIQILNHQAEEEKAENARLSSFVGAIAIGDLLKSTLGPKGMDKILLCETSRDSKVEVTNDGATILKAIGIDNPAAKVLVDISKTQDDEVGDGTTSVAVLASQLLQEAEKLVGMKIHPQTIISGWRRSVNASRAALEDFSQDRSNNEAQFKKDVMNIARTTLGSKILAQHKEFFAQLAVDAVMRLKGKCNLDAIHIIKKLGGSMLDSYLEAGFLLDKKPGLNQPKRVEKAQILIANTPMDSDKIKVFGSRMKCESIARVAELEEAEKLKMKRKVDSILAHKCNVFINRQLIYNYPEQLFADAGIMAIEHADFEGIERLALVTGGEIVSTFTSPETVKLGTCDLIEEVMIGEDKLLRFSGVPLGEACTIVLRVKEKKICYGGGSAEMLMAEAVDKLALTTPGKESLAIEAFARALRQLPTIIADNAGLDSAQLVSELRAAHATGKKSFGINIVDAKIDDMEKLGITEAFVVKRQVLLSASEAAEMILRVDNIIKAAPRKRVPDRSH